MRSVLQLFLESIWACWKKIGTPGGSWPNNLFWVVLDLIWFLKFRNWINNEEQRLTQPETKLVPKPLGPKMKPGWQVLDLICFSKVTQQTRGLLKPSFFNSLYGPCRPTNQGKTYFDASVFFFLILIFLHFIFHNLSPFDSRRILLSYILAERKE